MDMTAPGKQRYCNALQPAKSVNSGALTLRNKTNILNVAPLLLAVLLSQCGVPVPPSCSHVPKPSQVPADSLIAAAAAEWGNLSSSSQGSERRASTERYNAAVAKLFDQLRCGSASWESRAATIGTRIAGASSADVDPASLDALFPSSTVGNQKLNNRQTTEGVGVPLVGWKKTSPVGQHREKFLLPNGLPYNITAVLAFEGGAPVWHFQKRFKQEEIKIGGSTRTLAADWSAPNEFYWSMCELDDLLVQNVILPDRFTEETGIYFLQPYDPNKIPLVFVHGLVSSPDAFKNAINSLVPEPWFRKNYQIWLYNYPTGNPWIFSSLNFREKMREACAYARSKGPDQNLNRMVVVAHSMGGLLTRSSITDPGNAFYNEYFDKPIDQLKISQNSRRMIRDGTLYEPLHEPRRVVFMAVPHRGSPVATWGPSVWFSRLIRLPKTLTIGLLDTALTTVGKVAQGEAPSGQMTSIGSLSPNNPANLALNKLPLPHGVTFHSIIGDRGKGDTPNSSDGIVPYWSSHVTPVASEKIVSSNHGVPDNADAAVELKRILKLHLGIK